MTVSERSGKRSGSAARRFSRKAFSAGASGSPGSCSPRSRGELDDPLPALGRAHDAAQDGEPLRLEEAGDRSPLAAIMKSSISSLARFGFSAASRLTASPSNSRAHLDRLELERAVVVALRLQPLRDAVLELQVVGQPGNGRDRGRQSGPRPRATRRRAGRRASRGCARRRGRRSTRRTRRRRRPRSRPPPRGGPRPGLSDVRSVLSRSGSIGKFRGGV